MQVKTFLELVDEVLYDLKNNRHKEAFAQNVIGRDVPDMDFSEWFMTYLAWSEVSTKEDIVRYYSHLNDEDENLHAS